jgi:hypothetical protein
LLSIDPDTREINCDRLLNGYLSRVYAICFEKHVTVARNARMADVIRSIQGSSMGEAMRAALDCEARLMSTVRNVSWLIRYWTANEAVWDPKTGDWDRSNVYPDPLEGGKYGFSRSKNGAIIWSDEAATQPL